MPNPNTIQILLEVTVRNTDGNAFEEEFSEWDVEKTINTVLHAGLEADMHDSVKETVVDNLIHFKTKIVKI